MDTVGENEDIWYGLFVEGKATLDRGRSFLGKIPSDPRCMFCHGPFRGFGGRIMSIMGKGQSRVDPRLCNQCIRHGDRNPGGAHVPIATVFADMRGSTPAAERLGVDGFSALIDRFFQTSSKVLIDHGALLGRLAGDAAIGFFVPGLAGPDYARAALDSAVELLVATGHTDTDGPWIPLGVGVHAGEAFVGLLGQRDGTKELTALGDDVNIGARLADSAETGEILASARIAETIGLDTEGLEHRTLALKGKTVPFDVVVVPPTRA